MKFPSARYLVAFVVMFLLAVGGSYFIPPMQSPDENQHIARATLIAQGEIFLSHPGGKMSGGDVDEGMRAFIQGHMQLAGRPEVRLSTEEKNRLKNLQWGGAKNRSFMEIPGTGFYLPLIYAPHALALKVGEWARLSVHQSYYLTRFFIQAISIALMLLAFSMYRPGALVLGILALPMGVFQLLSPTLDGLTTSMCLVAISLFFAFQAKNPSSGRFYLLAFLLVLIATTRIHLIPLLLLLFVIAWQQRRRSFFWASVCASGFTLFWIVFAILTTVDNRIPRDITSLGALQYYVLHPARFVGVLSNTLSSQEMMAFYRQSFIGRLGWLDTSLTAWHYTVLSAGLIALALLNLLTAARQEHHAIARWSLAGMALLAVLAIFTALLISWTPHPATIVHGIQGRYFVVPFLLLAYALQGMIDLRARAVALASQALLALFAVFSAYALLAALLQRYPLA